MNNPTLNPTVTLSDGTAVTVHELTWKKRRAVVEKITAQFGDVAALKAESLTTDNVVRLLTQVDDLVEEIVTQTTNITPEQLGSLKSSEVFSILAAALELNVAAYRDGAKKAASHFTAAT